MKHSLRSYIVVPVGVILILSAAPALARGGGHNGGGYQHSNVQHQVGGGPAAPAGGVKSMSKFKSGYGKELGKIVLNGIIQGGTLVGQGLGSVGGLMSARGRCSGGTC